MRNKQVQYSEVEQIYDTYIKEMNTIVPERYRPPEIVKQLQIAKQHIFDTFMISVVDFGTPKHPKRVQMVDLKSILKSFTDERDKQLSAGYKRLANILNTITGDVSTLGANHVVCFGFDLQQFWMLRKEPTHDIEEPFFSYELHRTNAEQNEIVNHVSYLMTENDLKLALDADMDSFFINAKQQKALIKASIFTVDEFLDWLV